MNRQFKVAVIGLVALLATACNCSPTEPKYRCSEYGIVEVQRPWEAVWEPVSGSALVRCTPGEPITPENLR